MWLVTTLGFYSVVESVDDKTKVVVRSRVRADLAELRSRFIPTLGKIIETQQRDYQFRCVVSKKDFAAGVAQAVMETVAYPNFKNAVAKRDPRRAAVLGRVWGTLLDLAAPTSTPDDDGQLLR